MMLLYVYACYIESGIETTTIPEQRSLGNILEMSV